MKARFALEHALWAELKARKFNRDHRFLLACSGGADSVALVRSFAAVLAPSRTTVAHVHHGGDSAARNSAREFTQKLCDELKLPLVIANAGAQTFVGEKALRNFRRQELTQLARQTDCRFIVTAHHKQDVLETRMIRLIRGTGPAGLAAMWTLRHPWYRPFLAQAPHELKQYLKTIGQDWFEDPTNLDLQYLRNWLRHRWLPQLERHRAGSLNSVARSLEECAGALVRLAPSDDSRILLVEWKRAEWETLSAVEQHQRLARALYRLGVETFTRGQLGEIVRRLSREESNSGFTVAGCEWKINAQQIEGRLTVPKV